MAASHAQVWSQIRTAVEKRMTETGLSYLMLVKELGNLGIFADDSTLQRLVKVGNPTRPPARRREWLDALNGILGFDPGYLTALFDELSSTHPRSLKTIGRRVELRLDQGLTEIREYTELIALS